MLRSILLSQQLSQCQNHTNRRIKNARNTILFFQHYSTKKIISRKRLSPKRTYTKSTTKKTAETVSTEHAKSSSGSGLSSQNTRYLIYGWLTVPTLLISWSLFDSDDSPSGNFFKSIFANDTDEFVLRQMNLPKPKATLCSAGLGKKQKELIASGSGFYYGWFDEFLTSTPRNFANEYESSVGENKEHRGIQKEAFSIQDMIIDIFSEFQSTYEELCDAITTIGQGMSVLPGIQIKTSDKEKNTNHGDFAEDLIDDLSSEAIRRQKFEQLSKEIEEWAHHILFEEGYEEDGWVNIECSKLLRNTFNKEGKSKCYLKWFPDSRNSESDKEEDKEDYPCLRCYTTIDAPLEQVCQYLANESHMKDYNDLVIKYRDLEDLSPHSKICWSQCPQILFIKPRDFVTFCHHQWKKDGSQIILNQAVDHDDVPAILEEGKASVCRAYALRGANYLSRDPNDPNKTRFVLLAHANPGGNLPSWACRAAMNAVVPIIPFKIFHSIEQGVKRAQLRSETTSPNDSSSDTPNRSYRAGGISQVGYACFWPNGGGLKENEKDIWED